ncbi:hypothetical protein PF008_g25178 [Phytophthora fragariae]|uniref:Uncharacterized protein n=1 Tax=Phytophthora fragariae TaxID=53985 RepID=A0A6G0QKN6_9STRA|nr:hypothetical protein PF008_g25178 [Phytophthora fragariae]
MILKASNTGEVIMSLEELLPMVNGIRSSQVEVQRSHHQEPKCRRPRTFEEQRRIPAASKLDSGAFGCPKTTDPVPTDRVFPPVFSLRGCRFIARAANLSR